MLYQYKSTNTDSEGAARGSAGGKEAFSFRVISAGMVGKSQVCSDVEVAAADTENGKTVTRAIPSS